MMATKFTEQAVFEFLTERGGRVRQIDLTDHFEAIFKDAESKKTFDKDTLLRFVDNVAVVKMVDGVKFVSLKKECNGSLMRADTNGHDKECNGNGVGTINMNTMQNQSVATAKSDLNGNSDIKYKAVDNDSPVYGNNHPCIEEEPAMSPKETVVDYPSGEVKLRERRRRESAPAIGLEHDSTSLGGLPGQVRGGRRVSRGSQRALLTTGLSEDSVWEGLDSGCVSGDGSTPKGSRRNFIELMMSSSPQVRRSLIHRGSRLIDSVRSDGDSTSLLSSADDADCASVALDPVEHEWMLCSSDGLWDSLQPLLSLEPSLISKRDFVTGFTCLHWAAKQGKQELLAQLLAFAKENSVPADVNARSSAGYTPLHLAAMHGHTQVVRILMSDWEADTEARDYSGRKASQYLPSAVAADLQEGSAVSPGGYSDPENTDSGTGRWRFPRVLQSNLNPLRLLNMPTEGTGEGSGTGKSKGMHRKSSLSRINARLHRGRFRTQIIHSTSFREAGEVNGGDNSPTSPLKPRPLSNLFG
ncbi:ankyrin repeat domain-containing protein SOWAHC [Osmerus mordax]|uniref:ankyrin repeat domain-containing protein SOWAHC n=1 Tax=Osmerus mordax TaxID=8014 RepID=UPI00350EAC93